MHNCCNGTDDIVIEISRITADDVPDKVRWYNDDIVTRYLHYEDKFTIEKTLEWLKNIENDNTRYENVIRIKEDGKLKNAI